MRKGLGITVASAAAAFAFAAPASGAGPAKQACLGKDFSQYAREGSPEGTRIPFEAGSGFGHFTAFLAQSVGGLGLPIQTHLAGNTSDLVIPNTCND